MSRMVGIPLAIFPLLISLAGTEVTRQRTIFDEVAEDEWPGDFDAHDIMMLEDAVKQLEAAGASGDETVEFSYWKGMRLLVELAQGNGITIVARGQD